ncbi:MAG: PAS domain S-box protein, partial [Chitinophagaceae bacterium]
MLQHMIQDTEALIALPRQRVFFQTDEQGRIVMCNDLMTEFFGCEEAVVNGAWFPGLADEDERATAAQLLTGALEGRPDTGYVAFSTPSGRKLAQVTLVPQFQNGQPAGTFGFIHDATDRVEKTRRLIESERQYKELYERYQFVSQATSDVLWDWNLETNEIYINQSFTRLLGFELPTRHVSELWLEHLHPDDRDRVLRKQLAAVRDPGQALWEDQYRFFHADGSLLYLQDRAVIIRDASGRPLRMIGAVQDVTQRTVSEEAIRLSEEKYRLLFYQSPEPKWIFRREDLRFVEVNEAAVDHYGFSREEFLSMTVIDL